MCLVQAVTHQHTSRESYRETLGECDTICSDCGPSCEASLAHAVTPY